MRYHRFSMPQRIAPDGRVEQAEVLISDRQVPALWEVVRRFEATAERHITAMSYVIDAARVKDLERILRRNVALDAMDRGLSVLSISPLRTIPLSNQAGDACLEWMAVPFADWTEED